MKTGLPKVICAALCCALVLSACGAQDKTPQSSSGAAESADSQSSAVSSEADSVAGDDSSQQAPEGGYDAMVSRSLMSTGNLERMTDVINKLESGKETTIAFIGGSITEGMTAGPEKCWAKLTYNYLCEKYPDTKINYVNAGMSGTPSILGNIRLQRDVLDHTPDLVFVEFAVNDGNEAIYRDSYEALVRRILSAENKPAVALYFTLLKSGHTCEDYMSRIGEAYGLPMVSLRSVLKPEFDSGAMKWEDYSDDESHPNIWGHEMTKDLIVNMLEKVTEKVKESPAADISPLPDKWVYDSRFDGMTMVDREHTSDKFTFISEGGFDGSKDTLAQFPKGWSQKAKPSEAQPMEFTFTGKTLMMVYKCSTSAKFAAASVTVDGKEWGQFSTSSPSGWNNPDTFLVFSGEEGTHTVSVTIAPNEKDSSMYLEILAFGFC